MNVFQELLKCQQCKQPFNGTPVVTSCCNATICESHYPCQESLNPSQRTRKRKYVNCLLCNYLHEGIKKFAPNTTVEKLIQMQIDNGMYDKVALI